MIDAFSGVTKKNRTRLPALIFVCYLFSEKDLALSSNDDLRRDIGNHGSLVAGIIALLGPENVRIVNLKVRIKIL